MAQRSRVAVVYVVHDKTPGFEQRIWYGCEFRTGKLRRLDRPQEFVHVSNIRLAGHLVGYSEWEEDPAGSEIFEEIHIDDLRSGKGRKLFAVAEGYEAGVNVLVESLVVKPNGSVAWIARRGSLEDAVYQVHRVEADRQNKRTKLDESAEIRARSLALSDDHKRIYWKTGAEPRSARLR